MRSQTADVQEEKHLRENEQLRLKIFLIRLSAENLASSQAASQHLKAMIGSVTILCGLVTHESPHR